jgi:hypothetical protein
MAEGEEIEEEEKIPDLVIPEGSDSEESEDEVVVDPPAVEEESKI